MKSKQSISTADMVAAIRAMHLLHYHPAVFSDPYAIYLTSPALRRVCQIRFFQWLLGRKIISNSLRPISAQVLSRAKYTEGKLESGVSKGISQYVIISAGFDSFCIRRPEFSAGLQIYEIDHPATQQVKRERLMQILGSPAEGVEFLAVDLEKEKISDALSASAFCKEKRAFFSWLGTIPYLSEEAVFTVLRDLASFAERGSEIVFDYSIPIDLLAPEEREALARIMRIIARGGEGIKSFFAPDAFPEDVSRLGYHIFENVSPAELNNKYFMDRSDGLRTHSAAYIIHAEIMKG